MRNIIIPALTIVGGIGVCAPVVANSNKRPNIVFFVTDDQNKNNLGCYNPNMPTPNIDAIAKNGVKFTNANVVATVSSPSRFSILTGRYYSNNTHPKFLKLYPEGSVSCITNDCELTPDDNIAANLRRVGYTTAFVGKSHNARHDILGNNKNWEKSGLQTYDKESDPRTDPETNRKMKENHEWWVKEIKKFGFDYVNSVYAANMRELFNDPSNTHNVEWTTSSALDFLESQKSSNNPFLLYIATTYPHGPAPHITRGKDKELIYSLDADPTLTGEGVRSDLANATVRREELRKLHGEKGNIALTASWWDQAVGDVVKKLEEMGELENTLILYISDHGNIAGSKSTLYEDGTCIPFLMQWGEGIEKGGVYNHVVGSVDIAPTIYEVAGVKGVETNGVSMVPMFKDVNKATREALMMEMGYARAVKSDEFTYIAIRYPENPITKRDPKSGKHYIMGHAQLAGRSAAARPNYFEVDQLYDFHKDKKGDNNLFGQDATRDEYYKNLLTKESQKHSQRPFGEFAK